MYDDVKVYLIVIISFLTYLHQIHTYVPTYEYIRHMPNVQSIYRVYSRVKCCICCLIVSSILRSTRTCTWNTTTARVWYFYTIAQSCNVSKCLTRVYSVPRFICTYSSTAYIYRRYTTINIIVDWSFDTAYSIVCVQLIQIIMYK